MKSVINGLIATAAMAFLLAALLAVILSIIDAIEISPSRILFALLAVPCAIVSKLLLNWCDRRLDGKK